MMGEKDVIDQLIHYARAAYHRGLVRGTGGNASARLNAKKMLITASGISLAEIELDNLITVDINTCVWEAKAGFKPSIEYKIHADILRLKPEIGAVLHVHPPYATAFAVSNMEIPMVTDSGFKHPKIPMVAFAPSGTEELRTNVSQAISRTPDCRALLLEKHGLIAWGESPQAAYYQADLIEELAMVAYLNLRLGRV